MSAAAASIQELTTAKNTRRWSRTIRADRAGGKGSVGSIRQPTQIGARPDEFVPFRANPRQQAFAKLQPVLTSAGISTARAGRSGGPRVIGSTGTCDNGASSVFLALVRAPRCSRIPDVSLADDEGGAGFHHDARYLVMITTSCRALSLRIRMQLKLSCPDLWR